VKEREELAYVARGYGGGGARMYSGCQVCGSDEHMTWNCPTGLTRNKDARGMWITRCFNCLEEGHMSRACRKAKKTWGAVKKGVAQASSAVKEVKDRVGQEDEKKQA
jgi:hypothetical protein